ncbi:MAG: helix-turn-helix protein [Candidatus Omnitrophica bacterium ADurb.Bin277]|nr:MAG: helix-turn-helix protein [Candidatus Omnitrophica bacterium ADurb.Bin277]
MKKNKAVTKVPENPGKGIPAILDIGKTVRTLRAERGMSGVELCRRSGGLDPKTLTAVEKGRIRNPSIATLELLSRGLGTSVSGIFKRAEMLDNRYFLVGSQKGSYKVEFVSKGVQLISFTPLSREFFCGKIILESDREFGRALLGHQGVFFLLVLIGQVEGEMEGKKIVLKEGENLYCRGGMNFNLRNLHPRTASLLLVSVPACVASGF